MCCDEVDTSACLFAFEYLAQGTRDFSRKYFSLVVEQVFLLLDLNRLEHFSANRHPSRLAAQEYVQRFYVPALTEATLKENKSCFVDFGHHSFFGHVLSALKAELGPNMRVVRLRRARRDTAASYGQTQHSV